MNLSFLPVSLNSIGPTIGPEEAIHLLSGMPRDCELWIGPQGEHQRRLGGRVVTEEEGAEWLEAFRLAASAVLEALQRGDLHSFLWSNKQGSGFHVPRFYWNSRHILDLFHPFAGMAGATGGDDSMIGQAIMLSESKYNAWLGVARANLRLAATIAKEPGRSKRKTKSKPRWYPMLRTEFEKEVQRYKDWPGNHPNDLPPIFPSAPDFKRRLVGKGVAATLMAASVVRYHVHALKVEFGLLA